MLRDAEHRLMRLAWMFTGIFALVIAIFALMPPNPEAPPNPYDKIFHAVAFGVLVLPLAMVMPRRAMVILAAGILYGLLIEIVQPLTGRMFDLADLWADGVGAAIGIGLGAVLSGVTRWVRQV